ncbi:MAG: hypothetical protein ACRELY_31545 [Polyangiaceae bacterium]
MTRDDVANFVSVYIERPTRWVPKDLSIGDYEGRDRTLEVFNADAVEQRSLMRTLEPVRPALEQAAGGPIVVIFHSRKQSAKYAEFLSAFEAPGPSVIAAPTSSFDAAWVDTEEQGPHRKRAA